MRNAAPSPNTVCVCIGWDGKDERISKAIFRRVWTEAIGRNPSDHPRNPSQPGCSIWLPGISL